MPIQGDPLYWLIVGPAILIMLIAQWRMQATFRKWGDVPNSVDLEGNQIAARLLNAFNMPEVTVQGIRGELTDNYNPMSNVLSLSQSTVREESVAAMAVVAHEVGHAQQDAQNSLLMRIRSGIVPLVHFGSQLGPLVFIAGLAAGIGWLTWIGIALFGTAFQFALVTLPVEINASNRAMEMLEQTNMLASQRERRGARAVLTAAAWTYVAGMLNALFQVFYFISLALRGQRRGDGPN
ncbi:MAG: zinc metallopeptidase [Anaerolineae bacterium]